MKGRRLLGPGELPIRPTSDRAREALFSILQQWPRGSFLDLFAGTGAVGIEACSRGYEPVTLVEREPGALAILKANGKGTDMRALGRDARKLKADAFQGLSVIFADPPYEQSPALWEEMASRMLGWLAPGGVLVWETDHRAELLKVQGWVLINSRRYGAASFHFLQLT